MEMQELALKTAREAKQEYTVVWPADTDKIEAALRLRSTRNMNWYPEQEWNNYPEGKTTPDLKSLISENEIHGIRS